MIAVTDQAGRTHHEVDSSIGFGAMITRLVSAIGRRARNVGFHAQSRVHMRRLRRAVPSFPSDAEIEHAASTLREPYTRYVTDVSSPGWAVSFETSCLLLALCRSAKVGSAMDMGSGFSSYVLRVWSSESGATVCSVDDDPDWLDRTRDYLATFKLGTERLHLWPDVPPGPFDLVFHDIAKGTRREATMRDSLSRASRFVVWDDAHHAGHRRAMTETAGDSPVYNLAAITGDNIHRFAALTVVRGVASA